VIVSNPPYVPRKEEAAMQKHVRSSEPHLALFVPDEDPLLFYRHLCDMAGAHLKGGGWIYLEAHERFADEVGRLLRAHGFDSVEVKKDIFGKDRFVRGQWQGQAGKKRT
jgi:release factor glutamine methyltransferase